MKSTNWIQIFRHGEYYSISWLLDLHIPPSGDLPHRPGPVAGGDQRLQQDGEEERPLAGQQHVQSLKTLELPAQEEEHD